MCLNVRDGYLPKQKKNFMINFKSIFSKKIAAKQLKLKHFKRQQMRYRQHQKQKYSQQRENYQTNFDALFLKFNLSYVCILRVNGLDFLCYTDWCQQFSKKIK